MTVHNKLPVPQVGQVFGDWTVFEIGRWKNNEYYNSRHSCGIGTRKFSSHELWNAKFKPCKSCTARAEYRKNIDHIIMGVTYKQYRHAAKQRNIDFKLSLEEFKKMVTDNCHYCGRKPWQKRIITEKRRSIWHEGEFILISGIDRVNNSIGYEIENCVPCCKTCNVAKQTLAVEEFKDMVMLWKSRMGSW